MTKTQMFSTNLSCYFKGNFENFGNDATIFSGDTLSNNSFDSSIREPLSKRLENLNPDISGYQIVS